ncbi:phospholipase A and acyltransferase 4-like [Anabas testudineus]|uniref:phospholipase A and acyltransferase 4-like n=1 Tax=Anabas testudineus TaxID=64144 RepID=UPI000E45532D|nr:phospholipase A and acyltransferase 4-like [Anabas testudineus]
MRNLVLVAVILQLALIEGKTENYEFGDIISFERSCPCTDMTYKHFAIYVGDTKLDGKKAGQDIFQRSGLHPGIFPPRFSDCIFEKLEDEHKSRSKINIERKDNYFDSVLKPGTKEEIIKRIKEKKGKCGVYNPINNNCEHVATYIRYGERFSLQNGTSFEKKFQEIDKARAAKKNMKAKLLEIKTEMECLICRHKKG